MITMKYSNRFLKNFMVISLLLLMVVSVSGCATIGQGIGGIFNLFGTIIGGTFRLIGKVLDVVARMPKPPPGVF